MSAQMQQGIPTLFNKEKTKEDYDKFWSEVAPKHLGMINALVGWGGTFTTSGKSIGELYLWSILHQARAPENSHRALTLGTRRRQLRRDRWSSSSRRAST